ncbi:MAG: hypothetical protein ABI376_11755, partial [Caulobacteraceae bacterium]
LVASPTPQPAKVQSTAPTPVPAPPKPLPTPPAPVIKPAPAPPLPAPAKPAAPVAAAPSPAKIAPLNIHKPRKEAPGNVPTLPMAPAPGQAGGPSASPAAAGAPGTRTNGMSPFPYGVMPSGGPGLRGSLLGCANADSVKLSGAERARCAERFGVEIKQAPVIDPIPAARRADFDKAAARQENERKNRECTPTGTSPNSVPGLGYGLCAH